jgi:DNA-binding transcriptional LysR family regulator
MNLRHLSFLVALAQERHFGRAAQSVHVTQSTLSAAIRQLEGELGVPLVIRNRQRYVDVTAEGREVLAWAQRMLADRSAMQQSLQGLKGSLAGHLQLGVVPTAEPMIARVTHAIQERYPRVVVTILSGTSREIERSLAEHRIDAGISYMEETLDPAIRAVPFYLERYVVAGPKKLLPRQRGTISWGEAAQLPLCLLSRDMQNRRLVDRHFVEAGTVPAVVAESNTLVGVLSHIESGFWCGVVPVVMLGLMKGLPNVTALPLVQPEAVHRMGLLVPARNPLPVVTQAIVTVVRSLRVDETGGVKRAVR